MPRLTKSDVEDLTRTYDADPLGALGRALAIVLGTRPGSWSEMVLSCGFDTSRLSALLAGDTAALDRLFRDLIELRELPPAGPGAARDDAAGTPGAAGI